ncbi:MAG: hypothetical protein DMG06_08725 [Acidobacteria bacterium]|nr:MAG: hypothetical protein DMG06_08725 [Acidobacteriota bacterium]
MQCFQCGAEQSDGSVFCTKCGVRLGKASQSTTEGPQAGDKTSSREQEEKILRELKEALKGVQKPDAPSPISESPSTLTPKKVWIAGGFLILIILLILALALMQKSRKEELPPSPPAESLIQPPPPPSGPETDAMRTTIGKIAAILEAINQYSKAKKSLPGALTNLNRGYSEVANIQDGWGQNILYLVDLTNKTYVVRSMGPDGKRETPDDIAVTNETAEAWLKDNEQGISEWIVANPNLYAQLIAVGPSAAELKKLQAARKAEEEAKKKQEAEANEAAQRQQEEEQRRLETARLEQEKQRQAEAKRHEEELREARAREEALRRAQAVEFRDNFTEGLVQWDAPSSWEIVKDRELSALRVQGLGLLKKGENWDNYKMEFEVKVNKESAGWVVRAKNSSNFYLFKLGSEKAKAIPKNSLVKYIFSDGKYLNSLKQEDAPGAAGVTSLPFKVKNKEFYKVVVVVKGNTITHYINGIEVDSWSDNTFDRGRFGFNASIIEMATIRSVSAQSVH